MELMPLGTLSNLIRKKSLKNWDSKKQIMTDICEAGAFMHSSFYEDCSPKRIVLHQDLKSANVLLCMENGKMRAKIADFGLAFLKEFTSDMSKSKSVQHNGGTAVYQAPELFEDGAKFTKVPTSVRSFNTRNAIFSRQGTSFWR
jgi:serine/threonine protein kinase